MLVKGQFICRAQDLREGKSRKFEIRGEAGTFEGFLIRHKKKIYCYLNRCRHVFLPLDWGDGDFFTEDKKFLLFRQTKYAFDGRLSLAPVGGYLELNENPLDAAKRELREEMGYEAKEWIGFGSHRVDANRGAGNGHLFLALDAYYVGKTISDDLEPQELIAMRQEEVETALLHGEFKCLSWAALAAITLVWLKRQ